MPRWLRLALIIFVILFILAILFACGQLALRSVIYPTAPDTRSKLWADYRAWPIVMLPAINPAIVDDLLRDDGINPTVVGRPFWPTPHGPTPTPRPTLIAAAPTATSRPA